MRLAVTGFVCGKDGSVASANALLLRELLLTGHEIDFFSKATFVDPRPDLGEHPQFRFFDITNTGADALRRRLEGVPGLGFSAARFDSWTYHRLLVRSVAEKHRDSPYDACLWMGDYARGKIPGLVSVSFTQGPPGTDARSVLSRLAEIRELAGRNVSWRWIVLARLRLSQLGLPPFHYSDQMIVGSQQACLTLQKRYGVDRRRVSALPYPIDLEHFTTNRDESDGRGNGSPLRVLWLGRIVPRKRLDLFLDGAALAIRQGIDVRLSIFGGVGFIPGYESLVKTFPFPDRLEWSEGIARSEVPAMLRRHDVLAQPSDEENFGSSVAEAQACGLPVIVGRTNGNADYLCARDIHLRDDRPETFAAALREMAARKAEGRWGAASESRKLAEDRFSVEGVALQLMQVLRSVADRSCGKVVLA